MRAILKGSGARLLATLALLVAVGTSLSGEEIGEVAALAGSLAVIRAGEPLPGAVEGGTSVEAEDLLVTGEGYGEVILHERGRLSLWPATVIHLRRNAGSVEVELLAGTARLRRLGESDPVPFVSGAVTLQMRAGEATITADAGDLRLVVVESGRQPVWSDSGARRFAEPDRPVGYYERLINIEGSPAAWREAALVEFRSRGPGRMAERFREYLELRARFDDAYEALLTHRSTLNRWSREYRRGLTPEIEGALTGTPELSQDLDATLSLGEEMEERYYQLRLDAPYLREEFREHLRQEDAFLLDRLHFLRFLRAVATPGG